MNREPRSINGLHELTESMLVRVNDTVCLFDHGMSIPPEKYTFIQPWGKNLIMISSRNPQVDKYDGILTHSETDERIVFIPGQKGYDALRNHLKDVGYYG